MITTLRLLPAIALAVAGYLAVDVWRKRAQARQARSDLAHDLKAWEAEGGNLHPSGNPP